MDSAWIYFSVKVICVLYLLYRLWIILFCYRLFGLWDRLPEHKIPKSEAEVSPAISREEVLGRARIVYLEDPAQEVPVHSEALPRTGFIAQEEDILTNDVEDTLSRGQPAPPGDEELYGDDVVAAPNAEFSQGLTYDQIANAVGVLCATTNDDGKAIAAARTIYDMRNTDLFEFFTSQAGSMAMVEKLFAECLDSNGQPLPERRKVPSRAEENFSWDKYI